MSERWNEGDEPMMITIPNECECGHLRDTHLDGLCRQPECRCSRFDAKVSFRSERDPLA